MELKERIRLLGVNIDDCPPGITRGHFSKMLHDVGAGRKLSNVSVSLLSLVCDMKLCLMRARRWPHSGPNDYVSWGKFIEIDEIVKKLRVEVAGISVLDNSVASSGNPEQTIVERVRPHIESINESAAKVTKMAKDLPHKAIKSNAPIWVEEGHVAVSGANTYFKVDGQLWKVGNSSVSGAVDFGGDVRDVKSFKSK